MLATHVPALWFSFAEFLDRIEKNVYKISKLNLNTTCECQQCSLHRSQYNSFSLLRFALTAQLIWHFICVSLWTSHNAIDSAKDNNNTTTFICLVKIYSTGRLKAKQKMIRIFSLKFLKISVLPSQPKCEIARSIWTSSSVSYSKFTAQEIADRKRKDDEMRWTKFYQYPNMKYHAIVTRMKIYPTLATLFMTPVALVMEAQQMIPANTYISCMVCGKNRFSSCYWRISQID